MMERLVRNWVYGGFLSGILLLILLPSFASGWSLALVAVFLQLPVYMIHQFEEHDDDRFRLFVNLTMGRGREVLSPAVVFVINVPGVWGVIAASLLLAKSVALGLGLIGIYLTLVNAVVHVISAVASRGYNPGLVTAILMFLPSGCFGLWAVDRSGGVGWGYHVLGIGTALAIHAAIMIHIRLRRGA